MTLASTPSRPQRPVAVVPVATGRIGRGIALELAAHGHDIALHAREAGEDAQATAAELRALGARVAVLTAALDDANACDALLPQAVQALGAVDVLVNNASMFEHDSAQDASVASLEAHWRANTLAPVRLAQALARHLAARAAAGEAAQGCIVNLLDQKLWNPNPYHFASTLTKAALREATTRLAQALAPRLRVVAVAPGVTLPSGPMTDGEFQQAHALTPLARSSTPLDIARAVRFLVESPAITGTTLLVDGGQHLAAQPRDVLFLAQAQASPAAGLQAARQEPA